MWTYVSAHELYHHGIKGMRWGVRRYQNSDGTLTNAGRKRYKSTSLTSYVARRQNKKVDKGFDNWKTNAQKKTDAISAGKKANEARINYQISGDKTQKKEYKQANKEYKKALRGNTTYRKGAIRGEVRSDMSRKYMSEARKVYKQMQKDPNNKELMKQYSELMSKHDIERAKARKAPEVGAKRSARKAALKRATTIAVKNAVTATAIAAGAAAVNKVLNDRNVTLDGKSIRLSEATVSNIVDIVKKGKRFMGYMY